MFNCAFRFLTQIKSILFPWNELKVDMDLKSILKPGGIVLMLAKILQKDQYRLQSNF